MTGKATGLEARIRQDLERRIRSGDWPPGRRLPTEAELMVEFGCARMTVHKAIASLAAAGLVVRNKRAGTRVARPHVETAVLEIQDVGALIRSRGEAYDFRLLTRRTRPVARDDPDEQRLGATGRMLALEGLHLSDGEPFAFERRVINLAATPEVEAADFTATAPGSWLLQHVPWTEARHRIRAVAATPALAERLNLPRHAPCLQLERWTWRAHAGVTFVRQVYPGERYDLVADFAPGGVPPDPTF